MAAVNGLVSAQNQPGIELRRKDEERGEESELLQQEAPRAAEETKSPSSIIFWKCKLWMIITSVFLLLIFVIILSLILYSVVYIDEDEYWDSELIAGGEQHNFFGRANIKCSNPNVLLSESAYDVFSKNLNKRVRRATKPHMFNYAILGKEFPLGCHVWAEKIKERWNEKGLSMHGENNTASYYLRFLVPPESGDFMKYRMNEEFVMNILRQNIYDKQSIPDLDIPECADIILDPSSVTIKLI